ncbi:MAG: galactose-1-phosphate uridylyltransferase [Nitrospinaceae bacterium]|jgi:UDPglucose--hexose-1-phosphate uridylyltransferase|nr:MAG: galactose-1-phosphate uridylyltransferase [Nitrospinaceae bacterium]
MPELRKDPIVNRWVIISTERGRRPKDYPSPPPKTNQGACPFCPGNESMTPHELLAYRPNPSPPDAPGWSLRVIPNKFPALKIEGGMGRVGDGMYDRMNGIGAHEVLIESPNHNVELDEMPPEAIEACWWAFKQRFVDLKKDSRFRYILIFKNHGEAAGASLEHAHMQLIALPIVPELVCDELAGARRHYDYKERCIFCDLIAQELGDRKRVVAENAGFLSVCPYAPRFPYEMWLLPKNHAPRFEESDGDTFYHLAHLLKDCLKRIRAALGAPPYNLVLHTSPINGKGDDTYHWHIEIMPKLTKLAGFEQGTGFYINPTLPEDAAATLRSPVL